VCKDLAGKEAKQFWMTSCRRQQATMVVFAGLVVLLVVGCTFLAG
jgi:hypothetical protein